MEKALMMKVPPTKYYFPPEDIDSMLREYRTLLESGAFLAQAKQVEAFEKEFAAHHGTKHAVAVNSGTSAVEVPLRGLGITGGDVIVTTNTFAATAFGIVHAGNRPVFADVGSDLSIDPADVRRKITPKTKAVVTVHIGGLVSPGVAELRELCEAKGIPLLEDAAHAQGSSYQGRKAGAWGVAGGFSFFSTKVMTTGEGGMITTSDDALAAKMRVIRDQAKVNNQNLHEVLGYNWRMTEFQAIMGRAQLNRLDQFIQRRNEVAKIYDAAWAGLKGFDVIQPPRGCVSNFYKYVALVKHGARDALKRRLKEEFQVSFGGEVYERPLHQQPVFQPFSSGALKNAEDLCARHVCPPIYSQMTDAEAHHVADSVRRCVA